MTIDPTITTPTHGGAVRTPGELLARSIGESAIASIATTETPMRAVVLGPAGCGKTAALDALRAELTAIGAVIGDDLAAPADHVVIIDDADALDEPRLAALERRAADRAASLVVAHRTPTASVRLDRVADALEHSTPPVLLGEVTEEQIVEATQLTPACATAIVRRTAGLTLLTLAAVDAHDAGTCDSDPTHRDLSRALRGLIAHRLHRADAAARAGIEALCLSAPDELAALRPPDGGWDQAIAHGRATGLLRANGEAPAVVRSAVRSVLPVHRFAELLTPSAEEPDDEDAAAARMPARLASRADEARGADPARALSLYLEAITAGADAAALALSCGTAAVGTGDLDGAAAWFDRALHREDHRENHGANHGADQSGDTASTSAEHAADRDDHRDVDATAASAAVWAARGALAAGAAAVAGVAGAVSPVSAARRSLIALGVGRAPADTPVAVVPDTLAVASDALHRALCASLGGDVERAADELVLASELYSATHSDFPLVEPPAVVAAAAAIGVGNLAAAASVLDSAVAAEQCGAWAKPRLRLWRAWVAIVASRPDDARALLAEAADCGAPLQPRDRLIAAACEVALARRYETTPAVLSAMREATPLLLRERFDLYLFPFLGELLLAAVRVGAAGAVERHVESAFATLAGLGEPPLWATPLHWAGIQRGILQGEPELVKPHARALLAAAEHNPSAARLADAGRVWTEVLAGRVEPVAVEAAAHTLARDGHAWDGARLAAHGAARTSDRQAYAQLLACARELHPRQVLQPEAVRPQQPMIPTPDGTALSTREIEVARLVVQGKTYVEIGQTLFISPRTAEHHIARIRRRLDASSRSELLTKLRDMLRADAAAPAVPS